MPSETLRRRSASLICTKDKETIEDNRDMCAGSYVVQQRQAMRAAGTIPKDRYIDGSKACGTAPATMSTRASIQTVKRSPSAR